MQLILFTVANLIITGKFRKCKSECNKKCKSYYDVGNYADDAKFSI